LSDSRWPACFHFGAIIGATGPDADAQATAKGLTMDRKTFPDFGKELRRPFEIHEFCYDCAGFYDGCPAWPARKRFACPIYDALPDVMPGTWGQKFPATTRKLAAAPVDDESQGETQDRLPERKDPPRAQIDGDRRCGCGAPLSKGKRFCDQCRIQNRRKTMRQYMRQRRGSAAVDADSGVPFPAVETLRTHAGGDDLKGTGHILVPAVFGQTSV